MTLASRPPRAGGERVSDGRLVLGAGLTSCWPVQHHFPDGPSICSTSRQQLVGGGCGRTRRASARPLRIHRAPALSRNAYRAPAGTRAEKDDLVDADDEDYLSELESSDDHEAEAGTDEPPGAGYAGYRPNVGMVVFNRHLQVWMGRRSPLRVRMLAKRGGASAPSVLDRLPVLEALQFPQGGISDGELPHEAALRELQEETGMRSVQIVAEHPQWMTYDFPSSLLGRMAGPWRRWRGQMQKWFLIYFHGEESEINVKQGGALSEFGEYSWVTLSDAPSLVLPFKRPVYSRVAAEFIPVIRELEFRARKIPSSALQPRRGQHATRALGRSTTGVLIDPGRWTRGAGEGAVGTPVRILRAGTGRSEIVAADPSVVGQVVPVSDSPGLASQGSSDGQGGSSQGDGEGAREASSGAGSEEGRDEGEGEGEGWYYGESDDSEGESGDEWEGSEGDGDRGLGVSATQGRVERALGRESLREGGGAAESEGTRSDEGWHQGSPSVSGVGAVGRGWGSGLGGRGRAAWAGGSEAQAGAGDAWRGARGFENGVDGVRGRGLVRGSEGGAVGVGESPASRSLQPCEVSRGAGVGESEGAGSAGAAVRVIGPGGCFVRVVCGGIIADFDPTSRKFRALGSMAWVSGPVFERGALKAQRAKGDTWLVTVRVGDARGEPLREWLARNGGV